MSDTIGSASIATMNSHTTEDISRLDADHDNEQSNTSITLVRKVINIPPPVTPHCDMRLPNLVSTDETLNDSIQNLDITKSSIVTSHSGIITKECLVLLKPNTDSDIQDKKENMTKDKNDTLSKDCDSGNSENDITLPNLVNTDPVESDDTPLSMLNEQSRGRPCRHRKRVEYTESSPNSASDSDFKHTSKKWRKPYVPAAGPSRLRMQAQCSILTKPRSVPKSITTNVGRNRDSKTNVGVAQW